jgi:hypothetical protein
VIKHFIVAYTTKAFVKILAGDVNVIENDCVKTLKSGNIAEHFLLRLIVQKLEEFGKGTLSFQRRLRSAHSRHSHQI